MNRIKCIRLYHNLSQLQFAKIFNVDQTAVSNWETGKNNIDIKIIEHISVQFSVPMDFVCGKSFKLRRPMEQWHSSLLEEYENAPAEIKDLLLFKHGWGYFEIHDDEEQISNTQVITTSLTEKQIAIINKYQNADKNLQTAIELLLGTISLDSVQVSDLTDNTVQLWNAASSVGNRAPNITQKTPEEWENIKNAPETKKELL